MSVSTTWTTEVVSTESQLREYNDLHNRLRPYFAETWQQFEHELGWFAEGEQLLLLARVEGEAVALGYAAPSPWHPGSERISVLVLVLEQYQRHGIGSDLYRQVSDFARTSGHTAATTHVIATETAALEYWPKRGFREVERYIDVALELQNFTVPPIVLPEGVTIEPLSDNLERHAEIYEVTSEALLDIPAEERAQMPQFDTWLKQYKTSPVLKPDSIFLALADVDDTRSLVGVGELEFQPARPDVVWHGFTAVRRSWRRKGIARALKYTTIARAQQLGMRLLQTENEERNNPIRTLNIELGYKPLPPRMELHGPLVEGSS